MTMGSDGCLVVLVCARNSKTLVVGTGLNRSDFWRSTGTLLPYHGCTCTAPAARPYIHTYNRTCPRHTIAESPSVASPASITSLLVRAIHPYGACLPIRPIRVIAVNNSGRARRPCGADWNHPRVPSVVVVVARERPALSHGRTPHHTRARFGQDPPRSNQVRSPPQLPTNRQTADARPVAGAEGRAQFLSPFFPGEVMFRLDIMTMN